MSVSVQNKFGDMATTSCTVTITASSLPLVSLSADKSTFNVNDKVIITASLYLEDSAGVANWTCSDIDLSRGVALTPLSIGLSVGSHTLQLAICSACLTGGLSYTFQLAARYSAKSSSSSSALASLTIAINSPPHGGSLAVSPSSGRALSDLFTLETSLWTDDPSQLPLLYSFSAYSVNSDQAAMLRPASLVSLISSYLSPGLQSRGFASFCVAAASDSLGASANVTAKTTVFPPRSLASTVSATSDLLEQAFINSDAAAVGQVHTPSTLHLRIALCIA